MSDTGDLLTVLEPIARRAADHEGVDIAWCELKGRPGALVFRVFIETPDGSVGLSDCERVSKRLSVLLDVEDPIESAYTLEVSTPGLDRPLHDAADYERFSGKLARVKTSRPLDGRKRFVGRLAGLAESAVLIEDADGHTTKIPIAVIESGRLEVELSPPRSEKTGKRA